MKRFFIVTYWVHMADKNRTCHSITKFYIWQAPVFYDWVIEERNKISEENEMNLVILNCGKI